MKGASLVVAAGLVLGLVGTAGAHVGEPLFCFQFPDHLIPVIDGDISDWDIVPDPPYWIHMDRPLIDAQHGEEINLADCNVKWATGWNNTTNRVYFAAWIYDDVRLDKGEYFSMYFDPAHLGLGPEGIYDFPTEEETKRWKFARAQKFYFMRLEKGKGLCFSYNYATWDMEPPWGDAAVKYLKGSRGCACPAELTCEMYFTPWEDLNYKGPEYSKIVDLEEGHIMGIEIALRDTDDPEVKGTYWELFAMPDAFKDASKWGDLILAPLEPGLPPPPAVESDTWGRIKASFLE